MAPDDPVKLAVLTLTNTSTARAAPQRVRLRRVVPGAAARRRAPVRRHRARRDDRRAARAQRLQHGVRRARRRSGAPPSRPQSYTCDRAEFVGRNRTLAAPAALLRERLAGRSGAGLDPCARAAGRRSRFEPGETRRVAFVLGQGRDRAHAARRWRRATRRSRSVEAALARAPSACWDDTLGAVQVQHARRLVRSDRQPVAAVSDAELPHLGAQRSVSAGRRVRLPRSAAGRARADATRGPTCAARTCCAPRRGSSSKATCSTGGTRRAAAARARAARTICSGCRTPSPRYVARTGDDSVLDEVVPFLEAPPLEPDQAESVQSAVACRRETASLFEHAVRAIDRSHEVRRARAAAHRLRRLERRHEPRRARGPRRERVARLVPRHRAERLRRRSASAAGGAISRSATATRRAGSPACWSWPGTATGIAAPTSTTARRSGRCRTRSASSIR